MLPYMRKTPTQNFGPIWPLVGATKTFIGEKKEKSKIHSSQMIDPEMLSFSATKNAMLVRLWYRVLALQRSPLHVLERFNGWKAILHCVYGELLLNWWFLENRGSKKNWREWFLFVFYKYIVSFVHVKNIKLYPFNKKLQDKWKLFSSIFHLESRFSRNPLRNGNAP